MHSYLSLYIHIQYIYLHIQINMHEHLHTCMLVCKHACIYICTTCTHICTFCLPLVANLLIANNPLPKFVFCTQILAHPLLPIPIAFWDNARTCEMFAPHRHVGLRHIAPGPPSTALATRPHSQLSAAQRSTAQRSVAQGRVGQRSAAQRCAG